MFITEKGHLYDVHEECAEASGCQLHKAKDAFNCCQYISKGASCFYCMCKSEHPHVKLNAVWVECGGE